MELPGTELTRNGGAEICTAWAKQSGEQAQISNKVQRQWNEKQSGGNGEKGKAVQWKWNEWLRKS